MTNLGRNGAPYHLLQLQVIVEGQFMLFLSLGGRLIGPCLRISHMLLSTGTGLLSAMSRDCKTYPFDRKTHCTTSINFDIAQVTENNQVCVCNHILSCCMRAEGMTAAPLLPKRQR